MNKLTLSVVLSTVMIPYSIISLLRIITTSAPDFSVYYYATRNLFFSLGPAYNNPALFTQVGYPPFSLVPFIPFVFLPYSAAQTIWIIGSFIALIGVVRLLHVLFEKHMSLQNLLMWTCVGFLLFPTRFTLGMGQSNLIVLFLFLLGVVGRKGRNAYYIGGIFLGLAFTLKPHLLVIVPFLVPYRPKETCIGLFNVLVLFGLSVALFGFDQYMVYVTRVVPPLSVFAGRAIYYNQGIAALSARFFGDTKVGMYIAYLLSGVVYVGVLTLIHRRRVTAKDAVVLSLGVLLLVEPLAWQHHFVFLFPLIFGLWHTINKTHSWTAVLFGAGVLAVGVNISNPGQFIGTIQRVVILSHAGWGLILLVVLYIRELVRGSNDARSI